MGLREMKRTSGALTQVTPGFNHWHEGEQPHCPYPDCGRAFGGPIYEGRIVSTRIPSPEPDPSLLVPMTCRNCKREFQIAV